MFNYKFAVKFKYEAVIYEIFCNLNFFSKIIFFLRLSNNLVNKSNYCKSYRVLKFFEKKI